VAYYHTPSAGSWHFTPGARGGLQLDVALSDRLSMFFEPSVHAWNSEQFINRRTKFSPELRAEVGFTYHIGSNSSYPDVFEQLATDPQGKAVFDAHRWFVSVQGGVLSRHRPDTGVGFFKSFVKHHGEGNESFAFAASIGRWLNPIMAVRGGYEFEYTTLGTTLKQHSLAADLMFSLTSMALGYDPYRLFDFSLFGGLEAGFGRYKEANDVMINAAEVPRTVLMPGARAGMHVECNVTDRVGIFGEFQTHIWRTPRYLWSVYNHSPELRATVGVAYKF
jgi:hypothetical protein